MRENCPRPQKLRWLRLQQCMLSALDGWLKVFFYFFFISSAFVGSHYQPNGSSHSSRHIERCVAHFLRSDKLFFYNQQQNNQIHVIKSTTIGKGTEANICFENWGEKKVKSRADLGTWHFFLVFWWLLKSQQRLEAWATTEKQLFAYEK